MHLRKTAVSLALGSLGLIAGCSSCHKQTVAAPPPPPPRVVGAPPCSVPAAPVAVVPGPGAVPVSPPPGAIVAPPASIPYGAPTPVVPGR